MRKVILVIAILFNTVLTQSAQVTQNIEKKNVSVEEVGWKRVAFSYNNVGRGYSKVSLLTSGGANEPHITEIAWFKSWINEGSINVISNSRAGYWNNSRITFDGKKSYLEVYFVSAIPSLSITMDKTVWGQAHLIEGKLPQGGGTVITSAKIERVNFGDNDFILDHSGNVSIGTHDDPVDKFVVHQSSNEHWAGFISNGGGTGKGLLLRSGAASEVSVLQVEDNYKHMRFVVKSNGEVGIGTTNTAGNKLVVGGNTVIDGRLVAKEIKVEAQTADFVFEEDYPLKPLSEVEQFVKENKHLPEIPSAKKMEKDGVNLAEMNKLLLQKVEELTLYMIEQNKKMNLQSEEISKLKLELQEVKQRR
jgi:hypothetical protein